MRKITRQLQTEKMIFTAMNNLFKHQNELDLDQFTIVVLEALMLLEREEYLKNHDGKQDSANGSYPRSFKSLCRNGMQINIPRSRNGHFKPLMLD